SSLSRYCCRRRAAPSVPIQTYHRPVYNGGWNHEYGGYGDEPRRKREDNNKPNHVLLFTIINPVYPITVEVLHTISAPSGQVQRIVIFKKNGVQAMVEYPFQYIFYYMESATRAKETLHGADIYSGCCTLKIDFAKPTKLNVYKNDAESWDYTTPTLEHLTCVYAPILSSTSTIMLNYCMVAFMKLISALARQAHQIVCTQFPWMEFELISQGETAGGEPESCRSVVSSSVPWHAGSSPSIATRRFQLPASISSNAHTFAHSFSFHESAWQCRCHFVLPYRNFRVVPVRVKRALNAFSLFSHSSFPGWSVVDVIHHRERNFVVSRQETTNRIRR
ncbi:HNRPL protein, partial [Pseudoatta argentina]